jgi:hypothetical protein
MEESCPKDDEITVPCSFSGPLLYLAVSQLEAVNECKKYIETHVAEALSKAVPDLVKYLLSDKDWNGIKGIKPIEFEVLPNMPTSYKPKVKPLNGQLFKDVKTEFNRRKTYFYEDSQSPIASPLVVASKATHLFMRFCGNYP